MMNSTTPANTCGVACNCAGQAHQRDRQNIGQHRQAHCVSDRRDEQPRHVGGVDGNHDCTGETPGFGGNHKSAAARTTEKEPDVGDMRGEESREAGKKCRGRPCGPTGNHRMPKAPGRQSAQRAPQHPWRQAPLRQPGWFSGLPSARRTCLQAAADSRALPVTPRRASRSGCSQGRRETGECSCGRGLSDEDHVLGGQHGAEGDEEASEHHRRGEFGFARKH